MNNRNFHKFRFTDPSVITPYLQVCCLCFSAFVADTFTHTPIWMKELYLKENLIQKANFQSIGSWISHLLLYAGSFSITPVPSDAEVIVFTEGKHMSVVSQPHVVPTSSASANRRHTVPLPLPSSGEIPLAHPHGVFLAMVFVSASPLGVKVLVPSLLLLDFSSCIVTEDSLTNQVPANGPYTMVPCTLLSLHRVTHKTT